MSASGRVPTASASAAHRTRGASVSRALFFVDLVCIGAAAAGVHGPTRFITGLVVALILPGWSLVGPLRLRRPELEVGLTVATSLAVILVLAQVLVTVRLWHPFAAEMVLCTLCLPSLLWQSRRPDETGRSAR